MRILSSATRPKHQGRGQCPECRCTFEFAPEDVQAELSMWAGAKYWYLLCPSQSCRRHLVLEDCRRLGFLWRWLDGPPLLQILPDLP